LIRRKVLEKIATFSTHSVFDEDEETDASTTDSVDPDLVLANGSDSSGEAKVVAHSVDGEDGIVDVTMKEPSEAPGTIDNETSKSEPVKPS
jgi:ubiquitin carboxyl-terminal hydrolase 4/11/15